MRVLLSWKASVCLIPFMLVGCASVDPNPDYRRVAEYLRETTDVESAYMVDDASIPQTVERLLQGGLTIEEAAQLCVLNNPTLQSEYASVGIARADVVQSGLFSNPTLAFSVAFPEGGGRSNIQASLAQNIVDLWQIPIRKRAAERSLDVTILRLARDAAQLCVDTKTAYIGAVAATQSHDIAKENLDITKHLLEAALTRQKAGVAGELDVNLNRQTTLAAQLEVQQTRLDVSTARRRLAVLLGLTGTTENLPLSSPLTSTGHLTVSAEDLLLLAREHRLDLRAASRSAEAAAARVEIEYAKIFPDLSVGTYLERNERRALPGRDIVADTARASIAAGGLTAPDIQSRGQRDQERRQEIDTIFGPAFNMTLPIFDQNQAQIAKARFTYDQAAKEVEALERKIDQDIRQSLDQVTTAAEIAKFYEDSLLPQSVTNLELSRTSYEAGRASLVIVLEAQRALLTGRRAAVTARQSAATALVELERATAQPLGALQHVSSRTVPTSNSSNR